MKNKFYILLTFLILNLAQGEDALVLNSGKSTYFSGSKLHYSFIKNKDSFPENCTHVSWGIELSGKAAVRGRFAAAEALGFQYKLPDLNEGAIIKGLVLIHLENNKGGIINSKSYPLWILSREGLFSGSENVQFYTESNNNWVEVLNKWGIKGSTVLSLKDAVPGKLIAWDLSFQTKNRLGAELLKFVQNGGDVLILGSIKGDISLGIKGPDEISLCKGGQIEEEVKGFDFQNQKVLRYWLPANENGEFLLKGVRANGKVDQKEGYARVNMKNGKGRLSLCCFQLDNSINNDPSTLLLIRSFLTGENKR